jgi:fatty-acyl-CoA synthase
VRIVDDLPLTPTNKVLKRQLRNEALAVTDQVWERPGRDLHFEPRAG